MHGRFKAERERIIVLAHQTEVMARQKTLQPVDKYLAPPKRKPQGATAVLARLQRFKKRQDRKKG